MKGKLEYEVDGSMSIQDAFRFAEFKMFSEKAEHKLKHPHACTSLSR